MSRRSHPPRDSPDWERPDFCPFCGIELADGGAGFVDHLDDAPECTDRFETWRARVIEKVEDEWDG